MIRHATYVNMHKQVTVFDVESFIEEVKLRPAIWDYTTEEYSDPNIRKRCWAEICTLINPDYNEMTQEKKNAISFSLQQRWRNLRQCFKRETAKRKAPDSKSVRVDRKSYIYFDVMSFLTPMVSNKQASSKKEDLTGTESPQEDENDVTMLNSQSKRSTSQQPREESLEKETTEEDKLEKEMDEDTVERDPIRELCDAVKHSISKRQKTEARDARDVDDDKHFLLSLLSAVKSVPNHLKYAMRAEMMELVAKYSNTYSPLSGNSQYQSVSHNAYPQAHQPRVQVAPNYSNMFTHAPGNLHCQTVTRDAQPSSRIPSSHILPPRIPSQQSSKPKLDPATIKKTFERLFSWSKSQPKCLQTQVLALKASYDYMQR